MKHNSSLFRAFFGPRARRCALLGSVWLLTAAGASAASVLYSTSNGYQASATCAVPALCGGGLYQPERAADPDLNNYAALYTSLLAAVRLRLDLSATAAAGSRAGVVVANGTGLLNLQALGSVRLRTLLNGTVQESRLIELTVVQAALLGAARPSQLEFVTSLAFNQVELEVGATGFGYVARVFYAYGATVNVQTTVAGYVSRFGSPAGNFSTAGSTGSGPVVVCASTDVDVPERAADTDLGNYASFNALATVACPATLRVRLDGTAPAGYFAGFVVGSTGLLDLNALGGLRLRTFRNGAAQETANGLEALQLNALPGGQAQVSFRSTQPFDAVSIERLGLVSALDNLRLYYGFGVAPRTFLGSTAALSNFANPAGHSLVSYSAALCLGCAVANASQAADADLSAASYASLNVPVGILSALGLRLDLTQPGLAGNRAGVVLRPGGGLLDATALNALTVSTYDAAGYLLESQRGASLLQLALLPDGRQEIYFNTTRDFAAVEMEVASGVAALVNTRVYYAFADDRPTGFPAQITAPAPLPAELVAFAGRWANGAAALAWQTASERHCRRFVVERATAAGSSADFQPIGSVPAAGNSNSPRAYAFTDETPAAQPARTRYYRLRQQDDDGRETLSRVVAVAVGAPAAAGFVLYPNPAPASAGATLQFANPGTTCTVQIYSELGRLVRETTVSAATTLPVLGLAPGLYQVRVAGSPGKATQRLQVLE